MNTNSSGKLHKDYTLQATLSITLATSIWGFSHVSTKFALAVVHPLVLQLIRSVFSVAIFAFALRVVSGVKLLPLFRHWKVGLLLGTTGVFGTQILWLSGLSMTTAGHVALVYTLLPIFTALLAAPILKERISKAKWLGILIALAGAVLLAVEDGISFDSRYLLGDLTVLLAVLCWSFYTVFAKPTASRIGVQQTLTLAFMMSIPISVVVSFSATAEQSWVSVSAVAWVAILYLVFASTAGANMLFVFALKHLPSTQVAAFVYVQPIIAAIASVLLLGDVLTLTFLVAGALIFLGMLIFLRD